MISAFFTKILVVLAIATGIASLCLWLHEKGIRPFAALRKMSLVGFCALALWAAPFIQYGSTKGGGGTNNIPQLVIQPEAGLLPLAATNTLHQGGMGGMQQGILAGAGVSEPMQLTSPIVSTNTDRTITAEDFERGQCKCKV